MEGGKILNLKSSIFDKNSKRGFTLVEIVLVLVVVGIMLSGILPLFLNLITVNKTSEYYSTAYKLADSKLEELRAAPFDDLTSSTITTDKLPSGSIVTSVTNQIDGAGQPDIKKVDLRINWNFRRAQNIRVVTYIARNGIRR